jgi:molybdopterin/thiamine biosynthesis adenylyltransferase
VRRLSDEELARLSNRKPIRGWRLPHRDPIPELDVFVTEGFPYSLPRVALAVAERDVPHSESDGTLCIENERATFAHGSPEAVLQDQLLRAFALLEANARKEHDLDFLNDFERYWAHYTDSTQVNVITLLKGRLTTRTAFAAPYHDKMVVSDDFEEAVGWLRNCYPTSNVEGRKIQVVIAQIDEILKPSEYPSSAEQLLNLFERLNPHAAMLLRQVGKDYPELAAAMLVFPRKDRPEAQGAMILTRTTSRAKQKRDARRVGREPRVEDGRLWISNSKLAKLAVRRGDAAWVHGRYLDPLLPALQDRRVCVIGAGALGSGVALSLSQAGIVDLLLIDPDRLDTANLSRHVLQAENIGQNKAIKTVAHIRQVLPHNFASESWQGTWQELWDKQPDAIRTSDLIVCVTGNWTSDVQLSDLQKSGDSLPPIIFGWVEPFAAVGHAVLLGKTGSCLRCQFGDSGESDVQVTDWPAGDVDALTCGALHTPFGAAAMSFTASMIATMAVDSLVDSPKFGEWRIWSAGDQRIRAWGGQVRPQWINTFGDIGADPRIRTQTWKKSGICLACRGS